MEFPWSAFQQHGVKQSSAVRARLEKISMSKHAHDRRTRFNKARCSPFPLKLASEEPPVLRPLSYPKVRYTFYIAAFL